MCSRGFKSSTVTATVSAKKGRSSAGQKHLILLGALQELSGIQLGAAPLWIWLIWGFKKIQGSKKQFSKAWDWCSESKLTCKKHKRNKTLSEFFYTLIHFWGWKISSCIEWRVSNKTCSFVKKQLGGLKPKVWGSVQFFKKKIPMLQDNCLLHCLNTFEKQFTYSVYHILH